MSIRQINTIGMKEGADAFVNRLFPVSRERMNHDPFVLWDHFELEGGAGFPPHPHRGFEGITYLLTGTMKHEDSLGNSSEVAAGGLQRFTAGKGIVHSETPHPSEQTQGIQLWVNLAKRHKDVNPRYNAMQAKDIEEETIEGGSIRYVLGDRSPVELYSEANLLDVSLEEHAIFVYAPLSSGLIYVIDGDISVNGEQAKYKEAILFEQERQLTITANSQTRFLIADGTPHKEPILQHGPFVD